MRVPLSWLKEYVDVNESPPELAELLTMAGLEVEEIIHRGQNLDNVITAKIVEIKPHPNADKLKLAYVDTGMETLQVACGAPNIFEGAIVPLALPGAELPGEVKIQKAKIRGEESIGMLCSRRDLGISDDHTGIMILAKDVEIGKPFAQAAFVEDAILEIAITPNRGDCLSILGVAREVAAIKRRKLKPPKIQTQIAGEEINRYITVEVENPDGCPRYAGLMVRGVRVGPSPQWMQARLEAVGLRPISNTVDVTNYVLFEFGQPLHAFDAEKLRDRRIVVRNAKEGEIIALLDGTSRTMTSEDLLICDGAGPVAIAGVMGGENTEVDENTEDIFIESAYFDPKSIRKTSKRLGLVTESSYRFERQVDPDGVPLAAQRAAQLMVQTAGGRIVSGKIDVYPKPIKLDPINVRISRVNHLLGTELKSAEVKEILLALGMELKPVSQGLFVVQPPSYRSDITREADLIEEVARIWGYDKIPEALPPLKNIKPSYSEIASFRESVRDAAKALGYSEVLSYSFAAPEDLSKFSDVKPMMLANPLAPELSAMKTLLVSGLITTLAYNQRRENFDLKLFELRKIFIPEKGKDLPTERERLGLLIQGRLFERSWAEPARLADFFDLKGHIEALLDATGITSAAFTADGPNFLHPAQKATIRSGEREIGFCGKLHPEIEERYELKGPVFVAELDIAEMFEASEKKVAYRPFPRKFPPALRDIAVVVDEATEAVDVEHVIREVAGDLLFDVTLFDIYRGPQVGEGKKSLAFSMRFQTEERTLTDEEVSELFRKIVEALSSKLGAKLRE